MPTRPKAIAGMMLAVALAVLHADAGAQDIFRLTWDVERNPGRTRVTGQVVNQGRVDVVDVYVTAEALDANGKVVARGISFVSPSIPQGATAKFEAAVPAPPTATSFRVRVSNYRLGLGAAVPQAP